jgi:hypothetical protein
MNREFPWVRYWLVSELKGPSSLSDNYLEPGEDYLLHSPSKEEVEMGFPTPNRLQTLPELLKSPGLVLLGRPGAGKTTELKQVYDKGLFSKDGCSVLYRRASSFASQDADSILGEVAKLEPEGRPIRLVLDGADEWLMENSRFLNALEDRLHEHRQRSVAPELRLVISCRAAEWPEGKLAHLWPSGQFTVAKLCQLDEGSARAFVKAHLGESAESFWEEVAKLKIHFLAIWPHSLSGLVEEFRENNGSLPATLFDLVKRTALRRSDVHHSETDPERRKRLREHDAPVDWTYRLASRAAALGCFTGCPRISLQFAPPIPGVLPADALMNGNEPLPDGTTKSITQADLDELPRTALFDCHQGSLVFSHQLIREFLAAAWLADRALPVTQLSTLLGSYRADGSWRHFPQLSAVAAWLASNPISKDWRRFLIIHDPAVLLRADAAGLAELEKLEVAKALLECAMRDRALDTSWEHRHLRGLACQRLAEIVRPCLLNISNEAEAARDLAIELVRECQIRDCAPDLWQAVQNPEVSYRSHMANALFVVDKDSDRWHEVLDHGIVLDKEGALLGAALLSLVPRSLKVREVLQHLIPKRSFHFTSDLYVNAYNTMPDLIEDGDVIPIIRHSARHHGLGFNESWNRNEDSLLSRALRRLGAMMHDDEAMAAFIEWWWAAILSHQRALNWDDSPVKLGELGFDLPQRRHAALKCAAKHPKLSYIKGGDVFWTYFDVLINLPEDVPWLISQIEKCDPREELIYATWINKAFFYCGSFPEIREQLLSVYRKSPAVSRMLPETTEGRNIFEELEYRRNEYLKLEQQRAEKYALIKKNRDEKLQDSIDCWISRAQSELSEQNGRSWQSVEHALFLRKYSGHGPVDLDLVDEIKPPGENWMFESARLWLRNKPAAFQVDGQKVALDLQISSARALYALWDRLNGDAEVEQGIRSGWLPNILAGLLRFGGQKGDFTFENCILRFLPESAEALIVILRADYSTSDIGWLLSLIDPVANRILEPLKQLLLEIPPKPHGFLTALQWLAKHDLAAAEDVAQHWLPPLLNGETLGEADVVLMSAILLHLNGKLWPEIKDRLFNQREVAAKVLNHAFYRISFDFDKQVDLSQWPSSYLADVAELMIRTFPPRVDRYHDDETDDSITRARDHLIAVLVNRGMTDAITRLEALQIKGTERRFRQLHLRASKEQQGAFWKPLPADKFLEMAAAHDLRLVHTTDDLMAVVLSALETYQQDLTRSDKLVGRHLRHENDDTPKQENALSDQLVEWLNRRLKVHGLREVSNYDGKRSDILIQVQPPARELLSLIVEVKKDHSERLLEKMETQLKQLYLEREGRTHGIYLVFWFQDGAHNAHPGIRSFEQIHASLSKQAISLSESPICIKSHVLDCRTTTIRPANPHQKQAKQRKSRKKLRAP